MINVQPHLCETETKGRTGGGVDFYAKTINQNVINRNVLTTELIETLRVSYNGIFNSENIIRLYITSSCCSILFELPARLHTHIGVVHHRNMDNHVSLACFDPFHL